MALLSDLLPGCSGHVITEDGLIPASSSSFLTSSSLMLLPFPTQLYERLAEQMSNSFLPAFVYQSGVHRYAFKNRPNLPADEIAAAREILERKREDEKTAAVYFSAV
jgi:hypothetical protein